MLILDDYHFMQKISSMARTNARKYCKNKGIVWLAQYNDVACLLSQAGSSCNIHPVTYWVATMSESQQQAILEARQDVVEDWDIEYGDRQTQFVIIGTDLDQEKFPGN